MGLQFLKKGTESQKQVAQAEAESEARKKQASIRRFWMPEGKETQITFLDGELGEDGVLDSVTYWEHQVKLNGHFRNWFPCTKDMEPCPICAMPDYSPSLVAVFTILDHTKWEDKDNKTHQHERRLFACKRDTLKRLQFLAGKKGGLKGATFDVSRIGEKSAGVGSDFDYVGTQPLEDLAASLHLSPEDVQPYDYEEVIPYMTANELANLGFGASAVVGAPPPSNTTQVDYSNDL